MSRLVSYQLKTGLSSCSPPRGPGFPKSRHQRLPTFQTILYLDRLLHSSTTEHRETRPKICHPYQQQLRNYSVIQLYTPDPPAATLESPEDYVDTTKARFNPGQYPDLANDKVENWTSPAYANLPLQPDFTLFEPIDPAHHSSDANASEDTRLLLKTRIDTNLSDRLVYLIQHDSQAAEQLKSEIIKNAIELPANTYITSHCFDFLFRYQDIRSYLEWLPLVASSHLSQVSAQCQGPPISTAEIHLNQYLKLAPHQLEWMLQFIQVLIVKKCFSKHLSFAIIRHLVRTQLPATTIPLTEKVFSLLRHHSFSLELIKPSQDFLVLQLANQGYLPKALQLFYAKRPASESEGLATYPLLYQVLADQLMLRMNRETSQQTSQHWMSELEKLITLWRTDHGASLRLWMTPEKSEYLESPNAPSLTKQISNKYNRVFNHVISVNPQVYKEFSVNKLAHFTAYFRSLFDQDNHPKFIKAAKLANEIHQIVPLQHSFLDLQEKLGIDDKSDRTEEQLIKSFVLETPDFLSGNSITDQNKSRSIKCKFESRSDIVLLWAHSWMIFYHRSGQPHRAIQVFLDYFIPLGCDRQLLDQIQSSTRSRNLPTSRIATTPVDKYQKLIHPTTGVLTVLYDSILSACPPKLIGDIFESFLDQHFHRPSKLSPEAGSSHAWNRRLEPNLGSFRPFVKAYLKVEDVDGALNVLKFMHFHLGKGINNNNLKLEDEGGWMDLLEWCATHSSGPKPKKFDPNYQWGDLRKKKIKGWDGKMKEDLIYLCFNKFFTAKFCPSSSTNTGSNQSLLDFLEETHTPTPIHKQVTGLKKSNQKPKNLKDEFNNDYSVMMIIQEETKIFKIKNDLIEEKLNFLNNTNGDDLLLKKIKFPSLKLLLKIKFGFYLCKNFNGLKFINKLITLYK